MMLAIMDDDVVAWFVYLLSISLNQKGNTKGSWPVQGGPLNTHITKQNKPYSNITNNAQ